MVDTVQPVLDGLAFARNLDLSGGPKTITFGVSASDDSSGIDYVVIRFDKSFGSAGSSFYLFGSSDSWDDGSSTVQATIPVGAPNGTYTIESVDVRDKAGNQRIYTGADLAGLGIGTTISVTGADNTGPTLTGLTLDPTVDLSGGDATFHFSASGSDRSGLSSAVIEVSDSSNQYFGSFYLFGSSDSWDDGTSAGTDTIRVATPPGTYHVSGVRMTDTAGNQTTYTEAQLAGIPGLQTTFTVSGADRTGPTLTDLSFDRAVDLSGGDATFHFAAAASDRSGVGSVILRVRSEAGQDFGSFYLFGGSDSWNDGRSASTDTIRAATPPGTYVVYQVDLADNAGNSRSYSQAELQALGLPSTFTVGASDLEGPTLTGFTHPASVSLANGAAPVTFGVSASDRSGISSAVVRFDGDLLGAGGRSLFLFGSAADPWADGASSSTGSVPVTTQPGTYTVQSLELTDNAGNTRVYTTAQLAALGYSTTVTVGATDTTAPQLTALAFPGTVDVSTAAKSVTFGATASDNATGIRSVVLHFDKNFFGTTGKGTVEIAGTAADSWADGSSTLTTSFPTTTRPGTYTITDVVVTDGAGNVRTYAAAELAGLGITRTTLTVTGDKTAPQLTALTFPDTLDVSTGTRIEPFTAKASDNATGIASVAITFDKNLYGGTGASTVTLDGAKDSWADGASTLNVAIPRTAKSGTYTVTRVAVTDGAGNVRTYTTDQLKALGFGTSLTLTGGATSTGDVTAPELDLLGFPRTVDLSAGAKAVSFLAAGSDDRSGIATVRIRFDKDLSGGTGQGLVEIAGSASDSWSDGSSHFVQIIPTTARNGVYTVLGVDAVDRAGNVRSYTAAQLKALGFGTSLTVTGAPPLPTTDTTGPQIGSLDFSGVVDLTKGNGGFSFKAPATDPSGVRGGVVWFDHQIQLTGGKTAGFAFDANGRTASTFVSAIGSPIYQIDHIDFTDTLGHTRSYTAAQLSAFGLQTSFFVLTASFNVSASAVIGGTAGKDVLIGSAVNNVLYGLAGDDRLVCGGGIDWLYGGLGNDRYEISDSRTHIVERAGEGADGVYTSVSYTLEAGQEIETLSALSTTSKTALTLIGNEFANTIIGNAGANVLRGGLGRDRLDGGAGIDTADYSDKTVSVSVTLNLSIAVTVTVGGRAEDTILNIENLTGGSANDVLRGDRLDNVLKGGGGDDVLQGGLGRDRLDGGAGLDTADYSEKTASVSVTLNGAKAVSVSVGGVAEDTLLNVENVTGGAGDDVLIGDGLANALRGGGGSDVLQGGLGRDRLDGGDGFDLAYYDERTASVAVTLNGAKAATVFVGGVAEDTILNVEGVIGGTGADVLTGDGLDNIFLGNLGRDRIDGRAGFDTVYYSERTASVSVTLNGAKAATVFVGGVAEDTILNVEGVVGGAGNDVLIGDGLANLFRGGPGRDRLDGGAGIDTVDYGDRTEGVSVTLNGSKAVSVSVGGVAEDTILNIENLVGGAGNDVLKGDALANVFRGGLGQDRLDGGAGFDTADYSDKAAAVSVTLNGAKAVSVSVGGVAEDTLLNIENLVGGAGNDVLKGDGLANVFRGGLGRDRLDGGAGIDTVDYSEKTAAVTVTLSGAKAATVFVGGVAEDTILNFENAIGGSGNDVLTGDVLANRLTGGAGADTFVFAAKLGAGNIDHIVDMSVADDTIQLSRSIFSTLSAGTLSAGAFKDLAVAGAVKDADDRILYDHRTGALSYDADAGGAGAAVQFAVIDTKVLLTAADFHIV